MSDTQTAAPAATEAKKERPDLGAAFIAVNKKSLLFVFFQTLLVTFVIISF